jgi:outer membrane protein OmpA-like peptidoglycan-associated protein
MRNLIPALTVLIASAASAQSLNVTGTWRPSNWTIKASLKQDGKIVTGYGGKQDFWFRGGWQGSRLVLIANNFDPKKKNECKPRGTFVLSGTTVARLKSTWHMEDTGRTLQGNWARISPSAGDPFDYPYAVELERCGSLRTYDLIFKTNSDQLESTTSPVLRAVADTLKKNSSMKIEILGHTDSTGDAQKNKDLSQRRAEAAKQLLVSQYGADESRITATGAGADQPIADNTTEEGKAMNRRVEIVLSR